MRIKFALPAVALLLASASMALGNGLMRDGIGAISMGRAGVNLGFADNGAIIHDNPAAMTNVVGSGLLDVGVDTVICDLAYSDPDNAFAHNDVTGFPSGMVGLVHRNPDSPWAFGLGVYAPAGFGAEFHLDNPHAGQSLYKSLGAFGRLLPGVAYEVTDRLSIGATLGLGICHAELEGPFYQQTGPFAGAPSILDLQCTGVALTGGVGLQYQLTPATTLGIAYTEETRFNFEGNGRTTMITGMGNLVSEFEAETDIVWPRSLGIGLKHDLCACQRIGFDVVWYDWSHAFDEMPIRLSNPTNPVVGAIVGQQIQDAFPMRWRDSVTYRVGYEWTATEDLIWRSGYCYHRSPVPDSTLNPYLDGVLEHAVSLGFSRRMHRIQEHAWLNVGYQYCWSPTREVETSDIVGGDFDNSTFKASTHWIALSVVVPY